MQDSLRNLISQTVSINSDELEDCLHYFEPYESRKNELLEKEGSIPKYLYFIVSGYVRLFHINENGEEVTTHINCPPGFITSYSNFINKMTSYENVVSVTPCSLLRITQENFATLSTKYIAFKDFSISIFQKSIAYNELRSSQLATMTAEQRYRHLLETHSDIIKNVPLQYIASFLGMNAKSLSRIRKEMIK
jgi:CRP/FNR family transcriptional regulator, anaerobic regulatory protein